MHKALNSSHHNRFPHGKIPTHLLFLWQLKNVGFFHHCTVLWQWSPGPIRRVNLPCRTQENKKSVQIYTVQNFKRSWLYSRFDGNVLPLSIKNGSVRCESKAHILQRRSAKRETYIKIWEMWKFQFICTGSNTLNLLALLMYHWLRMYCIRRIAAKKHGTGLGKQSWQMVLKVLACLAYYSWKSKNILFLLEKSDVGENSWTNVTE